MKPSRFLLAIAVLTLSLHAADEQSVTVKTVSVAKGAVMVSADLQSKSTESTELTCEIRFSSCSQPQPGDYKMRSATADEGIYEDCTNVVLLKSSSGPKEKVGVYCWLNASDCSLACPVQLRVETVPSVISENQFTITGYPASVYMHPFVACASNEPCARTDKFHLDQVPTGCCVLIVANGDGQGEVGKSPVETAVSQRILCARQFWWP